MSDVATKLSWVFYRRLVISRNKSGFWASFWSFADSECTFDSYVRLYRGAFLRSVSVGKMSYISQNTRVGFAEIGSYCCIGPDVIVGGLGRHPVDRLSTHPAFYSPYLRAGKSFVEVSSFEEFLQTAVGNDVWIGARAVILDGIHVGDGALIAAGALVNKDVPPFAVVAGVPARVIRYRFDDAVIDALLKWKWWTFPIEKTQKISEDIGQKNGWNIEEVNQLIERYSAWSANS